MNQREQEERRSAIAKIEEILLNVEYRAFSSTSLAEIIVDAVDELRNTIFCQQCKTTEADGYHIDMFLCNACKSNYYSGMEAL